MRWLRARHAFTYPEVLVAIAASVLIAAAAMYVFSRTETFRRYVEKRTRYQAQWQSFLSLLERELRGLYDYRGDEFDGNPSFQVLDDLSRSALVLVSAMDNTGTADYQEVTYYFKKADQDGLYRKVRRPGEAPVPDDDKWRFMPDVKGFSVTAVMAGTLPAAVTIAAVFADPLEPQTTQTFRMTLPVATRTP